MDATFFAILVLALFAIYTSVRFERFRSRVDADLASDLEEFQNQERRINRLQDRINALSITPPEVTMNIASGAVSPEKLAPAPAPAPAKRTRPGARALTQTGVRDVRARRQRGEPVWEIANSYGVSNHTIYRALTGPISDWPR